MYSPAIEGFFKSSGGSHSKRLRVSKTHTGMSITEVARASNNSATFAEMAFKLVGVLLLPAGGIVMFLPQILAGQAFPLAQLSMLAAFVFAGVALHRWADKGLQRRVQVNPTRRELCIGTLNADGAFHSRAAYSTDRIESFFILRSKDKGTPAKLNMRLNASARSVCLFQGPEASLVPVLEGISVMLQPPRMRNQRVRTEVNGQFIRVALG